MEIFKSKWEVIGEEFTYAVEYLFKYDELHQPLNVFVSILFLNTRDLAIRKIEDQFLVLNCM